MASSSATSPIILKLKSSDGQTFQLEEAAAYMSVTLKNMIEDGCADGKIPLSNVDSATLTKVAEYCKHHSTAADVADPGFDRRFMAEYMKGNLSPLTDLIIAANCLEIKELLELTCQTVADLIKNMSPEKIRKIFNIINDFAQEEEVRE